MAVELLAPAGDFESLKAAIYHGANAVYLAGRQFGARAYAANFSLEELREAVLYAHLRNVKIYVTVNTLYRDDELNDVLHFIDYLYDLQVDALIVQDIGLVDLIKRRYDDFEIHISTQMSLASYEDLKHFEALGVKRAVLAREDTLEEVKSICQQTSLDIEIFVHGALCVCFSGQCLMSSMIGGRSGNQGQCAQPCRLNYQLTEDGKRITSEEALLSPQDLCVIDHIGSLIDAGVHSFKIEGRMKKPEYVAAVVSAYRKAIDYHLGKSDLPHDDQDILMMEKMFNRGYTKGYLFHDVIMDDGHPGHRGTYLGEVIGYNKKLKRVTIELHDTLRQGDSILFTAIDQGRPINKMYVRGRLVNEAFAGMTIDIEFNRPIRHSKVFKTSDAALINALRRQYQEARAYRSLHLTCEAYKNQPLRLQGICDGEKVSYVSEEILKKAVSSPITKAQLEKRLLKFGDTIFTGDVDLYMDEDVFILVSLINQARRTVTDQMTRILAEKKIHHGEIHDVSYPHHTPEVLKNYYIVISDVNQLKPASSLTRRIYMRLQDDLSAYHAACKELQIEPGLYIPSMQTDESLKTLAAREDFKDIHHFIVNDYGALELLKDRDVIVGTGFNVYNSVSASHFHHPIVTSYECTRQQLRTMKSSSELIMPIYGYCPNMIMKHCIISQHYFKQKKEHCGMCQKHHYQLIDRKNVAFEIMTDDRCYNYILNSVPLYLSKHQDIPISYLVEFTIEDEKTVAEICSCISKNSPLSFPTTQAYYKKK